MEKVEGQIERDFRLAKSLLKDLARAAVVVVGIAIRIAHDEVKEWKTRKS